MVNKYIKVYSEDYRDNAENYTFKWMPPKGPDNHPVSFDLKNDMLIFIPKSEGTYEIHLSITDISDHIISEEVFYYMAIKETTAVAIAKTIPELKQMENDIPSEQKMSDAPPKKMISKKSPTRRKEPTPSKPAISKAVRNQIYTVQVFARPSLEKARGDQIQLLEEGFDAYIQRHYRDELDAIWYRVRVGSFRNKKIAQTVKKNIDSLLGINSWVDIVKTNETK